MSDIFKEVDEALQQDKLLKIWDEYKNTIIAAIAVLLLSAGLTSAYHSWNKSANETETARLLQAIDSSKSAENLDTLIGDTRKNQSALAAFSAANLALEEGDKEKAATLYSLIVENRSTPRNLRDLARIYYIQNAEKPELNVLKPLLSDEKSPWIWHARIEAATLAATEGKYDQAITYLKEFQTVTTIPLSLKQRGLSLLKVYSHKNDTLNTDNQDKEGA